MSEEIDPEYDAMVERLVARRDELERSLGKAAAWPILEKEICTEFEGYMKSQPWETEPDESPPQPSSWQRVKACLFSLFA